MSLAANTRFASRFYELIYNDEDARACSEIPESACRVSPTNFIVLLSSYFLTMLGDAIANPKTVLTWVMTSVGAPAYLLGFLVPIRESGSLIPQLFIAAFVRRIAVRKWVWVTGALIQAVSVCGIGVAALNLAGEAAGFAIIALLTVFSLARGLCSVSAKDVLGKTIDKGRRGRLTGWSASAAGLVTVVLGMVLILTVVAEGSAKVYALALITAGLLWVMAAGIYSLIREFPGATEGGENAIAKTIERLGILVSDRPFRWFVITRSLLLCSALTAPYFVALGQTRIGGSGAVLGGFVVASGVAALVGAPIWGVFADRSSRKVMIAAAALTASIALLVAALDWLQPALLASAWFLPLAYFALCIAHGGVRVSRKTYVVDLAGGNKRTDYVSISNSMIGVVLLATGLIGTLVSVVSLAGVIAVLGLMGVAGAMSAVRLPET